MTEECGLISKAGQPVPLLGVSITGDILGAGARVNIRQRYKNNEDQPIEAIYKFPLPEGAAVCGFRIHLDGRVIKGQVEEREKAFKIYDEALGRGDGGYLLEAEDRNWGRPYQGEFLFRNRPDGPGFYPVLPAKRGYPQPGLRLPIR